MARLTLPQLERHLFKAADIRRRRRSSRQKVFIFLDDNEMVPFESAEAVADRILELARANHAKLVKG